MVAENQPHCDVVTLEGLLDETLDALEATTAEAHLGRCISCQQRMEQLAGSVLLLPETRQRLLESSASHGGSPPNVPGQQERDPDGQTLGPVSDHEVESSWAGRQWIEKLLRPVEPGQSGMGYLERYRVDRVIGAGGMGVVVAAFDPQLNRPVALKLLSPHLSGNAAARRRFAREARAVAGVLHPCVTPIYGVSEGLDQPYLVMPLVSGGSLQDRLTATGPLPLDEAIEIAAQVAEGLAAAHERGVVHRDIKPGNILTEENTPRIFITDFGLARAIDDATVTLSGVVGGTPQYMSPEQAAGEEVDARSDLFSLGSVLYAMLTGRPPFRAEAPLAILRKICDTPPTQATEIREELPPWVDRLLGLLMERSPDQRLQTAVEAASLLRQTEVHLRNPNVNNLPEQLIEVVPSRNGRRWAVITAAVIVMLVGVWRLQADAPSMPFPNATERSVASDSFALESAPLERPLATNSLVREPPTIELPQIETSGFEPPGFGAPRDATATDLFDWQWKSFDVLASDAEQFADSLPWGTQVLP